MNVEVKSVQVNFWLVQLASGSVTFLMQLQEFGSTPGQRFRMSCFGEAGGRFISAINYFEHHFK